MERDNMGNETVATRNTISRAQSIVHVTLDFALKITPPDLQHMRSLIENSKKI